VDAHCAGNVQQPCRARAGWRWRALRDMAGERVLDVLQKVGSITNQYLLICVDGEEAMPNDANFQTARTSRQR
jgi:hypothetical protein